MISLYLDTSSSYLYIGIVSGDILIGELKEKLDKDLSVFTLPKIKELLDNSNVKPNDINRIIVVNGPGSFTGIRIGVTIAKTYAWTLNKEIVTISSLEAMALSLDDYDYVVPMIDARRNHVFGAIYDKLMNPILPNQYLSLEALSASTYLLNGNIKYISNDKFNEALELNEYNPNILNIVLYANKKETINPHAVEPCYLKLTEAEENKK